MIGHLDGIIKTVRLPAKSGTGYAILSVGGVGYKVAATRATLQGCAPAAPVALWTHLAVREDALDLYGFTSEEELAFFELLLTVDGIGPRSALGTLDIASLKTLRNAIAAGNDSYLTKVSGIGKKTAAKIVFELKDKVGAADSEEMRALGGDEDALEAMRSLGYTLHESREALRKVPASVKKSSERLREALKILGKR